MIETSTVLITIPDSAYSVSTVSKSVSNSNSVPTVLSTCSACFLYLDKSIDGFTIFFSFFVLVVVLPGLVVLGAFFLFLAQPALGCFVAALAVDVPPLGNYTGFLYLVGFTIGLSTKPGRTSNCFLPSRIISCLLIIAVPPT